jgi:sugar phosphate isomerase/epimerase
MLNRRNFMKTTAALAVVPEIATLDRSGRAQSRPQRVGGTCIKLSCNLYSFNAPLTKGEMTLEQVLGHCARLGFSAVDPTGYYFPGYPKLPSDEYVYHIKRIAVLLGLTISGTGVRNDFTDPDPGKREADIELVKGWIECAARLGAPMLRVFAGRGVPAGRNRDEVMKWVVDGIRQCVDHGRKFGIMTVLQNHNDFIQTPEDVLAMLKMVDSEWLALNLDIGSFRTGDPYEQIARVAPYAITWQIKESVFVNNVETKTDLQKIAGILKGIKYRGYIQLETLAGDPKLRMPGFLDEVRKAISIGCDPD